MAASSCFCTSGVEGANRDHRRVQRVHFTRNNALQCHDGTSCHQDGVYAPMRICAMSALAVESNVHRIEVRERVSRNQPDLTGGLKCTVMDGDGEIRLRKSRPRSIFDHRLRATYDLFRRLTDEHEGATPAVLRGQK